MGLCFDYRIMNASRGFFFIPGVDLGIIYSKFQTKLMAYKLPKAMHREVILFNSKRWVAQDLLKAGVVDEVALPEEMKWKTIQLANRVQKPSGSAFRATMHGIKVNLYDGILSSQNDVEGMGMANRRSGIDRAAPRGIKSSL